jgi:hypothetical protein
MVKNHLNKVYAYYDTILISNRSEFIFQINGMIAEHYAYIEHGWGQLEQNPSKSLS